MKKVLGLLFFTVMFAYSLSAQRTVSGSIIDNTGLPMIGANVLVSGSDIGTITDIDGNFSLSVPDDVRELTVSYTGYNTQTIDIFGLNDVSITLQEGELLEEIVVTGTGAAVDVRRTAISVEAINAEDLPTLSSGSIDAALSGKIPGAWISSTNAQPGQQANILLRGINSLGSTQPMILVDGVQLNTDNNFNGVNGNAVSSRLADLDLNNIERVEVVQGAAAATIYGAQGANGVIQIFTKKGEKNTPPKISIESSIGVSNVLTGGFGKANSHASQTGDGGFLTDANGERLAPDEFGNWPDPIPLGPGSLTNSQYSEALFDQFDQIFQSNALNHRQSVSIRGGADKSTYAFTGSFTNQESILFGAQDRYNFGFNLGYEIAKNFNVNIGTDLIFLDNNTGRQEGGNDGGGIGDIANAVLSFPFIDFEQRYDVNGEEILISTPSGISSNPLYARENVLFNASNFRLFPRVNLNYEPTSWLEFDYKYGYDEYRFNFNRTDRFQLDFISAASGQNGAGTTQGRIQNRFDRGVTQNSIASAFFRPNLSTLLGTDKSLTATTHIAFDWRSETFDRSDAIGTELPPFEPVTIPSASEFTASEFRSNFVTFGWLVNQRIEFNEMLGVSGGFRIDRSSAFGRGSDAFFFPRGDIFFRLSEMDGWSNLKNRIPEFKLRAAYGEAGIQPDPFDRIVTLSSQNAGSIGILGVQTELPNEGLNVQVSKELEFGFDASVALLGANSNVLPFLGINFTYWDRTSDDVIRPIEVAVSSGTGSILDNTIDLESNGIQLGLNTTIVESGNFGWDLTANFSRQRTIVANIEGANSIPIATFFSINEGDELGLFRGSKVLTSLTETDSDGNLILEDPTGFEISPEDGYVVNSETQRPVLSPETSILGSGLPDFNMSFINDFRITDFLTVSAQINWVQGQDIYNVTRQWTYRDNVHAEVDDPVTINGETEAFFNYYQTLYNTRDPNSHFVEDGSYIRLKNLAVGLNIGSLFKGDTFFDSLNLTLSGTNIFTITDYTGFDPEASNAFNNPLVVGFDEHTLPNARTYLATLRFGF